LPSSCLKWYKTQTNSENHETCLQVMISYVEGAFAECHLIRSAKDLVKGPTGSFLAECQYSGHSAKSEPLPSVTLWTLDIGSVAVMATLLYQVSADTRQSPEKSTRQRSCCHVQFVELSVPSVTLGKAFTECFSGFAKCFRHSAEQLIPVVQLL
jgi:hypothetical protein